MKPILYAESETAFNSNGLGIISDAIDVTVEEELNGVFELSMEYPVAGTRFADLKSRAIILAKSNPVSEPQPFRIYRITKPMSGRVSVYARHIAYDCMGIPVAPFAAESVAQALTAMRANAAAECAFTLSTDKSTSGAMSVKVPKPMWTLMGSSKGSILDVYGGEYEFDRYNINLWERRGADRGVTIRYGKNLTTLEQDENCANCYTGVYPYWASGDQSQLVQLPERVLDAPGTYSYVRIMTLDLSSEFKEAPTEDQLREAAQRYMTDNNIGIPDVSLTVGFVPLEQTEEYKGMALLERVLLGDTVSVEFPALGVSATARVVKTRYKPLLDRYEDVSLGKAKANIADTIAAQKAEIDRKPSETLVETITKDLTAALTGSKGGCVRLLDTDGDGQTDEIYIADNPDPAAAVHVWRWNQAGWGASHNGYNGPFEMGATLDGGLMAVFVTAAHLIAGTIQSADEGKTLFIDLDNGIMDITGAYNVYLINEAGERIHGGYVGYREGSNGEAETNGIGVSNVAGNIYVIVTDGGVRLQVGDKYFYLAIDSGRIQTNADMVISGNLTVNGTVTAFEFVDT